MSHETEFFIMALVWSAFGLAYISEKKRGR